MQFVTLEIEFHVEQVIVVTYMLYVSRQDGMDTNFVGCIGCAILVDGV